MDVQDFSPEISAMQLDCQVEGATLTQNPPGRESERLKHIKLNTRERGVEKKRDKDRKRQVRQDMRGERHDKMRALE